jgi:hypothetical protein
MSENPICTEYLKAITTDSKELNLTIGLSYGLLVLEMAFVCVFIRQIYLNGKSTMTLFSKRMLALLLVSTFMSKNPSNNLL